MAQLAGEPVDVTDFALPDEVTAYANGSNTIAATSFTDLPSIACAAAITNPHPTAAMLLDVRFAGWISSSAGDVRACPRISGSLTVAAGVGSAAAGWGEILYAAPGSGNVAQTFASFTVRLPASTTPATFTLQAYQSGAAGTKVLSYASLRLVPIRFVF